MKIHTVLTDVKRHMFSRLTGLNSEITVLTLDEFGGFGAL